MFLYQGERFQTIEELSIYIQLTKELRKCYEAV